MKRGRRRCTGGERTWSERDAQRHVPLARRRETGSDEAAPKIKQGETDTLHLMPARGHSNERDKN